MSDTITRAEFEALKEQIARLQEQVAQLTAALTLNRPEASGQQVEKQTDEISEETLCIIAAAVAAYLGKRATVRFVRRATDESAAWRMQGRVTIGASHQMPRTRGW